MREGVNIYLLFYSIAFTKNSSSIASCRGQKKAISDENLEAKRKIQDFLILG